MSEVDINSFMIQLERTAAQERMPMDAAIALECALLNLPLMGGPSGRGYSWYKMWFQCPHKFFSLREKFGAEPHPPEYLQLGALYHVLHALDYAPQMGFSALFKKGLVRSDLLRSGEEATAVQVREGAVQRLIMALTRRAGMATVQKKPALGPAASIIQDATRLWKYHANYYDAEDLEPLAIEWYAEHPARAHDGGPLYTCRYDLIGRIGQNDPMGLLPGSIIVRELKTSKWLYESVKDGWTLDGEVLGQLWLWRASGCEERFGPLAGVVVDIVTKGKTPAFHRKLVSIDSPPVERYARWIRIADAEMAQAKATGVVKQNFAACWSDRFGPCPLTGECEQLAWRTEP